MRIFRPYFLWVFSCPCFLCSYTEIYFLRFPPPSRGLMISGSWQTGKGKRAIIRGKRKKGKRKKEKGKHFPVNLYFSKIYRTPSPPCCRGILSANHPPPIPKPSNIRGIFCPQAVECYLSSKSNIQNFPTTTVFSGNSR